MTKRKDRTMSRKLYDFKCPVCGAEQEELVTEGQLVYCHSHKHPESVLMERKTSAPGMVKGNFADKPRI